MTTSLTPRASARILDAATARLLLLPHVRRFWAKVDRSGPVVRADLGPCWLWTGGRARLTGYGIITTRATTRLYAHRVSLAIDGRPPGHLQALHRCDNPPCVNPAHLFLGTQADNMHDMDAKGRRRSVVPMLKGEAHYKSALTDETVRAIRARFAGGETRADLARAFGVTWPAIDFVVKRLRWRHVA